MDAEQLNEWLRSHYGITRSKMELEHLTAFHQAVSQHEASKVPVPVFGVEADTDGEIVIAEEGQEWPE